MNRKEIIHEIGKLEDKLERQPELEDEINRQIREWGKLLEGEAEPKEIIKRGRKSLFDKDELAKMAKTMTGKEIAKKCHVAPQSVSYYMKKYGIKSLGRWGKKGA